MTSFEARFYLGYYIIDRARLSFSGLVGLETLGSFVEPQGLGILVSARIQTCDETQCETSPIFLRQLLELCFQVSVSGTHALTILLKGRAVND
jgi:hypothetical protein